MCVIQTVKRRRSACTLFFDDIVSPQASPGTVRYAVLPTPARVGLMVVSLLSFPDSYGAAQIEMTPLQYAGTIGAWAGSGRQAASNSGSHRTRITTSVTLSRPSPVADKGARGIGALMEWHEAPCSAGSRYGAAGNILGLV